MRDCQVIDNPVVSDVDRSFKEGVFCALLSLFQVWGNHVDEGDEIPEDTRRTLLQDLWKVFTSVLSRFSKSQHVTPITQAIVPHLKEHHIQTSELTKALDRPSSMEDGLCLVQGV